MEHRQSPSREPNHMVKAIAKSNLSIDELRIMARIIEALSPEQKMKRRYEIQNTLFNDTIITFPYSVLVPENYKKYSGIVNALSSLRERSANLLSPDLEIIDGWISKAIHYKKESKVDIIIGEHLIADYIALGDGYAEYMNNVIFKLNSKYSINLYKLICKNKDMRYFNLSINYLRDYLGIPHGKYSDIKDIRKRIIHPTYLELKKKSNVFFEIDYKNKVDSKTPGIGVIKKGRKIVGYRIEIIDKVKKASSHEIELQTNKFVLQYLAKVGVSSKNEFAARDLRSWCIKYGYDNVSKKLMSVSGYVKKSSNKMDYIEKTLKSEFENSQLSIAKLHNRMKV